MKPRIKKIRGTRTCGGGRHKNRRGKGSKGGSGNAGTYKHHLVRSLKAGIKKGKHGFHPHTHSNRSHSEKITLNVGELEEMLEELIATGKAEQREDGFYIDVEKIGVDKILGGGKVTRKLNLRVKNISSAAKEKIERAGGVLL
jgi:large subunit ribosomal protein L15